MSAFGGGSDLLSHTSCFDAQLVILTGEGMKLCRFRISVAYFVGGMVRVARVYLGNNMFIDGVETAAMEGIVRDSRTAPW